MHLVDVVPTILDAAHIPMPATANGVEQKPLAGKSFLASFTDPNFKGRSEQYFEIFTNRSYYEEGWKADARHAAMASGFGSGKLGEGQVGTLQSGQANNLAATIPEKLARLKKKFDEAAEKYHVYPFDNRGSARLAIPKPPVTDADPKSNTYTYYYGAIRIAEPAAPPISTSRTASRSSTTTTSRNIPW